MRVITNAQSVAATQNDPFYRSSLADHTRRQIRNLQLAQAADQSFGKGEPVIATQTPFPQNQDLPIITESPVESKSVNLDYSLHAHEAIHTPPSPLDIGAFTRAGAQRTTANPTLAPQQDISPISASDTTDSSAELVSPIVSNIWQLDQDRDLTNIGFALGLNTAPMSGQHQTSQGYGWNNNLEPSSAPHDRTTFRGDRQDSIGNRNFSYPGQSYPPPLPAINTGFQPYTLYPPAQNAAATPRNDYSSIDPARLNPGPGGFARNYEQGNNHSRPSPLRSPTQSPMAPYGLAYGDNHGQAESSAGSMSAREPSFTNPFGSYTNGRVRRHSDDIGALDMPRYGAATGKRKATWSGGESDLASIKQELEDLAATEREVAELKNDLPSGDRKERRRIQNKLAQRAFRARSKVHSTEVSKHINDLEDTVDSQADHIDKLMGLVERLQTENMLLRKATDWSALGLSNEAPRLDDREQTYRPPRME